jgi:hypothetical protein
VSTGGDRNTRPLLDLRISVIDRCNFRLHYCMPREIFGRDFVFVRREQILSFGRDHPTGRPAARRGVGRFCWLEVLEPAGAADRALADRDDLVGREPGGERGVGEPASLMEGMARIAARYPMAGCRAGRWLGR